MQLKNLGDAQTAEDREAISVLQSCLDSHKKAGKERGSLMTMLAMMTAQNDTGMFLEAMLSK